MDMGWEREYIRTCPICGKPMKYKTDTGLRRSEKCGVCCRKCHLPSSSFNKHTRDLTDFDERISEGFGMLSNEEHFTTKDFGCLDVTYVGINVEILEEYLLLQYEWRLLQLNPYYKKIIWIFRGPSGIESISVWGYDEKK